MPDFDCWLKRMGRATVTCTCTGVDMNSCCRFGGFLEDRRQKLPHLQVYFAVSLKLVENRMYDGHMYSKCIKKYCNVIIYLRLTYIILTLPVRLV